MGNVVYKLKLALKITTVDKTLKYSSETWKLTKREIESK